MRLPFAQFVLAVAALSASACGESKAPTYPAKGRVTFDGKPTPRARVWLHPETGSETNPLRPCGDVAEDGCFELSTHAPGDGAPAGRYRVAVFWYQNWLKGGARGDDLGPSLLPAKFQNPETSGLPVVVIAPEPNVIPTIELKR